MQLKQRVEDFVVDEQGSWQLVPGDFILFKLTKRNLGTLDAVKRLSELWRIPLKNIGYAGLKDKQAVTTQTCSVKGVPRLAVEKAEARGMEITYLGTSTRPVTLGSHSGNAFTIVVRDIDARPNQKTQFLNLFGEQRFSDANADIGKALVHQDFKRVVALLRQLNLPESAELEHQLQLQPTDLLGAVKEIPLKLLVLFVHAYQSKLWNEAVLMHARHRTLPGELPIVGFGVDIKDGVTRAIMEREQLTPRSFVLKAFPELSMEGTLRKTQLDVDVQIGKLEPDELNKGRKKVTLAFTLPPGAYATEIIRQLFTNSSE